MSFIINPHFLEQFLRVFVLTGTTWLFFWIGFAMQLVLLEKNMQNILVVMNLFFLFTLGSCSLPVENSETDFPDEAAYTSDPDSEISDVTEVTDEGPVVSDNYYEYETSSDTGPDETAVPDEAAGRCMEIMLTSLESSAFENASYYSKYTPDTGAESVFDDLFLLSFKSLPEKNIYNLSDPVYRDQENCEICIEVSENANDIVKKNQVLFLPVSGDLSITEMHVYEKEFKGTILRLPSGYSKGTIRNLVLREMNTDTAGFISEKENGRCLVVTEYKWDTVCIPQCEGKICGPDGCGGTCGGGCDADHQCSADQSQCIPWNCNKISLINMSADPYDPVTINGTINLSLGSPDLPDVFVMTLFNGTPGTYELNDEINGNVAFCSTCLYVYQDISNGRADIQLFQHSGTIAIEEVSYSGNNHSRGSLIGVRLVEYDPEYTDGTFFIPEGKCLEIEDMTWNTLE